jgi:hypothetical protein
VWAQALSSSFADVTTSDDDPGYGAIRRFTLDEALWRHDGRVREVLDAAATCARELGVELRLPAPEDARPAPRVPGTPACDWPWRSTYVRHDGLVQPCCMLMGEDRGIVGDLAVDDVAAVWHGDPYRALRAGLLTDEPPPTCRGCSAYRHVF